MCFFSKISSKYASAVSYFDGLIERDTFFCNQNLNLMVSSKLKVKNIFKVLKLLVCATPFEQHVIEKRVQCTMYTT